MAPVRRRRRAMVLRLGEGRADPASAVPHCSGKVTVVGHTPQFGGHVLDLGFLLGIDTNCVRGGWLTAVCIETGEVWQADRDGRLRPDPRPVRMRGAEEP